MIAAVERAYTSTAACEKTHVDVAVGIVETMRYHWLRFAGTSRRAQERGAFRCGVTKDV